MKHPDIFQIWIAFDQLANTMLGGYADETISSRAYRAYVGNGPKLPRNIINAIFYWQNDHCRGAYNAERQRTQLPPEMR